MRDFVRYIQNLTNTIKAQQKGLRRLSRKNKRLLDENQTLTYEVNGLRMQLEESNKQSARFAQRLHDWEVNSGVQG